MEAAGSRLGRASSRYGAAPVFHGPVRRWQKDWVHVSSSPISNKRSNNSTVNKHDTFVTRIRRWTPVPATHSTGDAADVKPKRKLRYTPIVVLEEKKKKDEKLNLEDKANKTDLSAAQEETCFRNETRVISRSQLGRHVSDKNEGAIKDLNESMDLDFGLKGHDGSVRSIDNSDWVKTGFAC